MNLEQPTWCRVWITKEFKSDVLASSTIKGVLVYQLDINHYKTRKIRILHLSCIDFYDYTGYLKQAVDHIFTNDSCTEIQLTYKHITEDGKLVLPPELKDVAKEAGFKWRTLINEGVNSRLTLFEVVRKKDIYGEVTGLCLEPVKQTSFALISQLELNNPTDFSNSERQFQGKF